MPGRARTRAMSRIGAREAFIFDVIATYVDQHKAFPSSNQVLEVSNWGDRGRIVDNMARLERRGFIHRPRKSWSDGGQITAAGLLALEWIKLFPHRLKKTGGFGVKHTNHGAGSPARQAALSEGRTFHPYAVGERDAPLGFGRNVTKLGSKITKGWAKGKTMYYLALEERATCPRSCVVWDSCYGNSLPFMKRNEWSGAVLQGLIRRQLNDIFKQHRRGRPRDPAGIMIRLHELGDFPTVDYVHWWGDILETYLRVSIFGYTAHHPGTPIGDAIALVRTQHPKRFAIRHSHYIGVPSTRVIEKPSEAWPGEVVCPEQTGRVKDCARCGLCWMSKKRIVFLAH